MKFWEKQSKEETLLHTAAKNGIFGTERNKPELKVTQDQVNVAVDATKGVKGPSFNERMSEIGKSNPGTAYHDKFDIQDVPAPQNVPGSMPGSTPG